MLKQSLPILGQSKKHGKPPECGYCRFNFGDHYGSGYCPDYIPNNPKVLLVFPYPSDDEVNQNRVIKWGFWEKYVEPFGYTKQNCQVTHLIRCTPGKTFLKKSEKIARKQYPTGSLKKNAENSCRYYDVDSYNFHPTRFLITLDPADVYAVTCYQRQIQTDFGKAFKWAKEGIRTAVLLGNEPAEFFAKFIIGKGSAKSWRGHYWDIEDYPYRGGEKYEEQKEFGEAKISNWRRS